MNNSSDTSKKIDGPTEDEMDDPVLQDVIPYCSDPELVREELRKARASDDPVTYLERKIIDLNGRSKGDVRILLNRLTRKKI